MALWFGVAGFGGGYVVMQRVRRVIVDERGWMTEGEFLTRFPLRRRSRAPSPRIS